MDTFSVSIAAGCNKHPLKRRDIIRYAFILAVFQGVMPVAGWMLGSSIAHLIAAFDHWVAFGLLCLVGGKMAYDGICGEPQKKKLKISSYKVVVTLAIATSIDALAVGFTLSTLSQQIFSPAIIIGLTTLAFALTGVWIGRKVGHRFQKSAEIIGGILLIAIGVKIVIEHLAMQ
jgi:putative Mn2+ efflux pump MntP